MVRSSPLIASGFAGLLAFLPSAPLGASLLYPTRLREHLGLAVEPACVLCHATATGGAGTAITPFVQTLKTLGLEGNDDGSLLAAIEADIYDTDGDLVADIQELKDGSNPNQKDRTVAAPPVEPEPPDDEPAAGAGGAPATLPPSGAAEGGASAGAPAEQSTAGAAGDTQAMTPSPAEPAQAGTAGSGSPMLATAPPPPPPRAQDLPLRETGCGIAPPNAKLGGTSAGLLGLSLALALARAQKRPRVTSPKLPSTPTTARGKKPRASD